MTDVVEVIRDLTPQVVDLQAAVSNELVVNNQFTSTVEIVTVGPQGPAGTPGPLIEDLQVTLVFATEVYIDLSLLKEVFDITLTGDTTIHVINGSAAQDGKKMMLRVVKTGSNAHQISFGPSFRFGSAFDHVPLTLGTRVTDYIGFVYNHAAGKADLVAYNLGFF